MEGGDLPSDYPGDQRLWVSYTLAVPPDSWAALGKLINLSGLPCSKNSGNGSQRMRVVCRLSGICEQLAKLLTVHALGTRWQLTAQASERPTIPEAEAGGTRVEG